MKTIYQNKRLSPQLLAPNLPGTVFQSAGQGLFFDEASMNRVRVYSPVANPQSGVYYPYYFNVNVTGDNANTASRSLIFDLQIKDPLNTTKLTKVVGEVSPAYVIDGINSTETKAQVDLYQDNDLNPDVLGIVVGQQNSPTNYGIVIYVKAGLEITGFTTANLVQGCGNETSEITFGGVAFPVGVSALPNATFNRKNVVKFAGSGQYSTLNRLFEVDQDGNAKELSLGGGGGGSGITPPIRETGDTMGVVGSFHQMDVRGGGLIFTLPSVADQGVEYGDVIRVGDYLDSASILTPVVITSSEPIHGETDEDKKTVYLTSPARTVWQYQGPEVGWYCVDGIGEGDLKDVPYEEVIILPFSNSYPKYGQTITCPSSYKWADFAWIEVFGGNQSKEHHVDSPVILTSEVLGNVGWQGQVERNNGNYFILEGLSDTTATVSSTDTSSCSIKQIKGYTKYKPALESPKRTEVLYESDLGKQRGETVTLSESMVKFDQILITAKLEYGGLTYVQTATYTPKEILTSGRTLDAGRWIASSNNTDYCLVQIITDNSSETTLGLGGGDSTYSPGKIIKVEGFNFLAQNVLAGGSGAGISPPVLKTTDFDIEFDKAYALDMSDDVSKTVTVPIGMLDNNWFTINSIRSKNTDGCFITISTPYDTWGYGDGTAKAYRFPAKANSSYTIQKIDGQLFIIASSGVAGEFVDAPWDGVPYVRRNGLWVPANPNENKFINPNMRVWQEEDGTSRSVVGGNYITDGWILAAVGNITTELQIAEDGRRWLALSDGSSSYRGITQRVEAEECLGLLDSNKLLTVSCRYIAEATDSNNRLYVKVIEAGTENDWTTLGNELYQHVDLIRDGVEQVANFTFDASNLEYWKGLQFEIVATNSSDSDIVPTTTFLLTDLKLEFARIATPCIQESAETALKRCQRFYKVLPGLTFSNYGYGGTSYFNLMETVTFEPMVKAPNPTVTDFVDGGSNCSVVIKGATRERCVLQIVKNVTSTPNVYGTLTLKLNARL